MGELAGLWVGQPLHELAALLQNGEVCREGGVKHMLDPQGPDCRGQALFRGLFRGKPQALSPGGPDRRRNLENHLFGGIAEGGEDGLRVVPLPQSPHGTVDHALAAQGAAGLVHPQPAPDAHRGMGAGAGDLPDPQGLDPVTDRDAPKTFDAFGTVPQNGKGRIPGAFSGLFSEGDRLDVHGLGQGLEGAVAAAHAGDAVVHVLGQDELHIGLPGQTDPLGIGVDHHALFHQGVAGGGQLVHPLHLHGAHPAGGHLIDLPQVAQGGDMDVHGPGGVQNGGAGGDGDLLVVDGQGHHLISLPPLKPA